MTSTLEDRRMREKILDVREERRMATPLEMRTDALSGHIILEGYASTFHAYDVHGGPAAGGWVEQLDKRAFDVTLAGNPDVMLLINHTDMPLARTKSGTLSLRADDHGLLVRADLDPSDPDVQRLLPKMRRGDMDEMSFAFHVRAHDWSSDYTHRMITEVDLRKGDVSVVNFGMNPNTAAMVYSAVDTLASLSKKDLQEIRSMDSARVRRALAVLTRATTPKKYADVSNFADPGYLPDKKKRYPLNSAARVRNAAARFAQNKGRYTKEQQAAIMGKIRAAAKRFGVEISDGDKKSWGPGARSGHRAFTTPYVWQPDVRPSTGQDAPYTKDESDYDRTRSGRPDVTPGADLPGVPAKGGYDAHNEPYGPKQVYALYLLANDEICPGGEQCPGDTCPDHGTEMDAMDGLDHTRDGSFGGKKAKPFGSDDDEDDKDDDEGRAFGDNQDWSEDDEDEHNVVAEDVQPGDSISDELDEEMGEYERGLDSALAAALERTIATCYQMAEAVECYDLRNMLARARRQVRDLQHIPSAEVDVSRKLNDLRKEFGDPDTITVSEGLRAISQAGFADVMKPTKEAS